MERSTSDKPFLTVFTPAYNRAYTLGLCYESLLKQSNKNFVWLIIDDGSADNTRELVEGWIGRNNGFEIKYIYKSNGGMHTAHNTAYEHMETELCICIDSDDYLADEAVEKIFRFWEKHKNSKYAGIIGLDADFNNKIIGKGFDDGLVETTLSGYYESGGKGDKKLVYRTEVMKSYPPYPVFEDERFFPLGYKFLLCDQDYTLLVMNEILCNVEYMADGSTRNMYSQYRKNPKGFAKMRTVSLKYEKRLKRRFVLCVHFVSSSLLAKDKRMFSKTPAKLLTVLAFPFGAALSLAVLYKTRKNKNKT